MKAFYKSSEKAALIMMGLPGSGKTTFLKRLRVSQDVICSADHYFERGGNYDFRVEDLTHAHEACLRKFVSLVTSGSPIVAVDNTNTDQATITTYIRLAWAYGYDVNIMHVTGYELDCFRRNIHGVPLSTINKMAISLEDCSYNVFKMMELNHHRGTFFDVNDKGFKAVG